MLTNYRKSLDKGHTKLGILIDTEKRCKKELIEHEKELELLTEARIVFKKAALVTQNHLADHLSSIVTKAIQAVFYEKEVYFKVEFVERRNTVECDFWLEENGHEFEILESRGYGLADIVSFSLRVAYILLHTIDNVLIIDEPCRNLSKSKHVLASEMIQELSRELDFQFIISTHSEEFIEHADKAFRVTQNSDGLSSAKLV